MCFYTTFKDQRKKNRERLRRGRAIKYTSGETNMLIALLKTFAFCQFFSAIAQEIADLRGISVEEIKDVTTQNAKRIFNF